MFSSIFPMGCMDCSAFSHYTKMPNGRAVHSSFPIFVYGHMESTVYSNDRSYTSNISHNAKKPWYSRNGFVLFDDIVISRRDHEIFEVLRYYTVYRNDTLSIR